MVLNGLVEEGDGCACRPVIVHRSLNAGRSRNGESTRIGVSGVLTGSIDEKSEMQIDRERGSEISGQFPRHVNLTSCSRSIMLSYNSSPSLYLPPTPTSPAMGVSVRTSEDTLFDEKVCLDPLPLPAASQPKAFGKRKRTLFAAGTLASLLFLASYLAIQYRVSDRFEGNLEPFPFSPEDAEPSSNATYPVESRYSGVRGPPTPLFRGARLSAAGNGVLSLTGFRQLIAR